MKPLLMLRFVAGATVILVIDYPSIGSDETLMELEPWNTTGMVVLQAESELLPSIWFMVLPVVAKKP